MFKRAGFIVGLLTLATVAAAQVPNRGDWCGTLQSEAKNADQLHTSGARLACVEVLWSLAEPKEGTFDEAYLAKVGGQIGQFRKAGMGVVLSMGFQYPPRWAKEQAGAQFIDQFGDRFDDPQPGSNGINAVFSAKARASQATYVKEIFKTLGTDWRVVRVGGGFFGELGYPHPTFAGRENCYWAFDPIAQGAANGLADGVGKCPVPGWKPGTPSADHADAKKFAEWYMNSLKNYHDWQISLLRDLGYKGKIAMLYPSWGIRPGGLAAAVAGDLGGTTSPEINGEVQRGFDFARFVAGIQDKDVIVYTTWLDSNPTFGDDASSDPARWSPPHYLAALAHQHHPRLDAWGENTGGGDDAVVTLCADRIQQFGLLGMMWAFEEDLIRHPKKLDLFKKQVVARAN